MKQFAVGIGFLMFVSSLPADDSKERPAKPEPSQRIERAAAEKKPRILRASVEPTRILHRASYEPPRVPTRPVLLTTFGNSLPPVGFVTFCRDNDEDCKTGALKGDRVKLTASKLEQLRAVNNYVNESVEPVTDSELYGEVEVWIYPRNGKGDCEDYVLLKRRLLIERGWPQGALLITVVRDENNEGHAVLTVRTDGGDFVLDNKNPKVLPWTETSYTFIKQQSTNDPLTWVSLLPPGVAPQTTVSASNRN
jgi:predicted transglutaminase-like cysteine proteinase